MIPQTPSPNQNQSTQPQTPNTTPGYVNNDLTVMQPGEQNLFTIKRHPAGILGIYIGLTIVLALVAGLMFALLPSVISDSGAVTRLATGVFVIFAGICVIYALIATVVYWGNRWIVTSDSITQVEQLTIFNRESSQLALSNIENVSAEQHGILGHLFNYGTLKAETAGHHEKFMFYFCPNPNYYAQRILSAREALGPHAKHGNH